MNNFILKIRRYSSGTLPEERVAFFLKEARVKYQTVLQQTYDVNDYAKKLSALASGVVLESPLGEWGGACLGYCNDKKTFQGFVSFIAKLSDERGEGTLLLNEFIEMAKKNGMTSIALEVNQKNENAIRFYNRMGFHIEKYMENSYILRKKI